MHAAATAAVNRNMQVAPNKTHTTVCMHISEQHCGMVMWLLLYSSGVAHDRQAKLSRQAELRCIVKQSSIANSFTHLLPVAHESFWQPTGGTAPPAALARPAQGSTHN